MVFGVAHRNVGLNVGMRERISSTSCFRRDIELFIAQTILLHPYRGMTLIVMVLVLGRLARTIFLQSRFSGEMLSSLCEPGH